MHALMANTNILHISCQVYYCQYNRCVINVCVYHVYVCVCVCVYHGILLWSLDHNKHQSFHSERSPLKCEVCLVSIQSFVYCMLQMLGVIAGVHLYRCLLLVGQQAVLDLIQQVHQH